MRLPTFPLALLAALLLAPLAAALVPLDHESFLAPRVGAVIVLAPVPAPDPAYLMDNAATLGAQAACDRLLAENATKVVAGYDFYCQTNCVTQDGHAVCTTQAGSPSSRAAQRDFARAPAAPPSPLGHPLWLSPQERARLFDRQAPGVERSIFADTLPG